MVDFLLILIIVVLLFTAAILLGYAYVYYEMERQKAQRKAKRRKTAPPAKKPVNPKAAALSEASSQRLHLNMMAINAVRQLNDVASRNLDEDNWADFR